MRTPFSWAWAGLVGCQLAGVPGIRSFAVAEHWQTRAHDSLGISGTDSLWSDRPDILLERYTDDETAPETVFVGE